MRELSDLELEEKAELVRKYLKDEWSIHVALRKAGVCVKHQPYIRGLVTKELEEYKKRVKARFVSSTGIETSYI